MEGVIDTKKLSYEEALELVQKGSVGYNLFVSVGQLAPIKGKPTESNGVMANIKVSRDMAVSFIEAAYGPIQDTHDIMVYFTEKSIFIGEEALLI